nr:NAD(P)H-dependent glycerol-3-phosphate dehydrogenase [Candidatus Formimonas warabiya]
MNHITVLGAGSWGTALATLLASKGLAVNLWARDAKFCAEIARDRENPRYLPGIKIPQEIKICADLPQALKKHQMIVLSVPSQSVREIAKAIKPYLSPETMIVNTAKGFETETLLRLSQVLCEELPTYCGEQIGVLSGPSHAEEVAVRLPTAVVVAANHQDVAETIQDTFMTPFFRVYTNMDLVGVEIAGALKNIIALGTGISDGLGYGDNTKAAMITRGLAEITRLGLILGAEAQTFAGLAGIGDLVVTCTSMHSRNRRAGIQIGQGHPIDQVLSKMGMVVEGVSTTRAAHALARKVGVSMPITEETYQVLFEGKEPVEAVTSLMSRCKTHEGEKEMLG